MASARTPAQRRRKRSATSSGAAAKPRQRSSHKPAPNSRKPRAGAKPAPKPKPRPKSAKPKSAKPKSAKGKAAKPKAVRPASSSSRARRRPRALTVALTAGILALGLAAAYFFWFRDSGFVAVEQVAVEGMEGPEAAQVTDALTKSARGMTTLNVDERRLAAAVSGYPTVVAVDAQPDFPHGLTIEVTGRPPVLTVSDGGPAVPVAGDGTLLRGVAVAEGGLPAIEVDSLPAKGKLAGEPLALAKAAGAAPAPLRPLIEGLGVEPGEGIEVTLEGALPVKMGDPDALEEKWAAVAAILANPQVKTLTHLDVRVPERPSIGGAAPAPRGSERALTP
ncbi:MAG: cell division protein FtsQ/DivIB [Actinomycetota bacterium]|nr:cell division protein FtsQ/DivIB [Actinomycetota bacterium]